MYCSFDEYGEGNCEIKGVGPENKREGGADVIEE